MFAGIGVAGIAGLSQGAGQRMTAVTKLCKIFM